MILLPFSAFTSLSRQIYGQRSPAPWSISKIWQNIDTILMQFNTQRAQSVLIFYHFWEVPLLLCWALGWDPPCPWWDPPAHPLPSAPSFSHKELLVWKRADPGCARRLKTSSNPSGNRGRTSPTSHRPPPWEEEFRLSIHPWWSSRFVLLEPNRSINKMWIFSSEVLSPLHSHM